MLSKKIDMITRGVDETRELGNAIGTLIDHPLIIAMTGDLGSGKTAFVQGLARGLGVPEEYHVTSPTFTLINEYPARRALCHVDLYRLDGIGDLEDIGLDDLLQQQTVVAIEWADKLAAGMLTEYLAMSFEIIDDQRRRIRLHAYGQNEVNLLNALGTHPIYNRFKQRIK